MKTNKDKVYDFIVSYTNEFNGEDNPMLTTSFLSEKLNMQRTNVSSLLNQLVDEGKILKNNGRPVLFYLPDHYLNELTNDNLETIVGASRTLQETLQVIKAGLVYPNITKEIFLMVESGNWFQDFAKDIYNHACLLKQLKLNAPFVIFDSFYYQDNLEVLFETNGFIEQSFNGMLVLMNVNYLPLSMMNRIMAYIHQQNKPIILLMSSSDDSSSINDLMKETVNFVSIIPALNQFGYDERFELIQKIICQEAMRLKKSIVVNHGLLQCMMIFTCHHNASELKNHLCKAIASSYSRSSDDVVIEMSDLSIELRKSMLHAEAYITPINEVIGEQYNYTFTATKTLRFIGNRNNASKYQKNERKEVKQIHGVSSFKEYLKDKYDSYNDKIYEKVDLELVDLVQELLIEANKKFKRVYSKMLQKIICLDLYQEINQGTTYQRISNEEIMRVIDQYPDEYFFARNFIKKLEAKYQYKFMMDESILLTLYLTEDFQEPTKKKQVVTLVAMHGHGIGKEIVRVVKELMHHDNIYSFDMDINEDVEKSYDELKNYIQEIDQGEGIIVIYDMGSLKVMLDSIMIDTKINIKYLEMPITLLAMSSSKYSQQGYDLNSLYAHISSEYTRLPYKRVKSQDNIIIVLNEHDNNNDAIINRINQMEDISDYTVIPITYNDDKDILNQVNELARDGNIKAIIGEYNPYLLNIHFISTHLLDDFNTISSLLADQNDFDILEYLDQQFDTISKEEFQLTIMPFCNELQKLLHKRFNEDTMIGLLVHIACLVDGLLNKKSPNVYFNASQIIARQPELVSQVALLVTPIEQYFNIKISQSDIATIISITN